MVTSPKTGRELDGEPGDKAPPRLRKLLDRLGISAVPNPKAYETDDEN